MCPLFWLLLSTEELNTIPYFRNCTYQKYCSFSHKRWSWKEKINRQTILESFKWGLWRRVKDEGILIEVTLWSPNVKGFLTLKSMKNQLMAYTHRKALLASKLHTIFCLGGENRNIEVGKSEVCLPLPASPRKHWRLKTVKEKLINNFELLLLAFKYGKSFILSTKNQISRANEILKQQNISLNRHPVKYFFQNKKMLLLNSSQ